ncbi:hypothetical protein T440DRAFT_437682 [Plenodomus tracheiphilus IPT5]|uniref:DNA ligase D 3'-phosphoesterase domain-containing protein n=1 Tax=Plenodomus tracheiphilus IPT5 TaxID=1408161 RepID=A0A6A7BMR2_9PLEO|nr:hypothetical protein T440DRAFT_437682 [Plenodomus tracheiphilus IPT5]
MANVPPSLSRDISPPRSLKRRKISGIPVIGPASEPIVEHVEEENSPNKHVFPTLAAVEAGKAKIDDHLTYFCQHLSKSIRPKDPTTPHLSLSSFGHLYASNCNPQGHHFVLHQHNHPRAGIHYDLRLQFSASSSLSFAIPKGLPGNPNSRSIGRLAVETRVHNYWNHLIESASHETGSLIIWDTGTYSVLPRKVKGRKSGIPSPKTSEDEDSASDEIERMDKPDRQDTRQIQENQNLISAFQSRYIRLRLHGTRLPPNYTIILRLPSNSITKPPARCKNGRKNNAKKAKPAQDPSDSEDTPEVETNEQEQNLDTDTEEDAQTRATNAYPGATNDIGSIHQRHWFLQLDRQNSGFELDKTGGGKGVWVRKGESGGFEPFLVRGRDVERSVVTGRLARDVESDEGVEGFVGRGGWVGVYH